MGTDKAVLDFCGRRMVDLVVDTVGMLTERVVVVTKRRHRLEGSAGQLIEDERPYAGPLPALIAGLRATETERTIVVACDMPFLNPGLLRRLAEGLDDDIDAVVPVAGDRPQPLHAAYGACALEPLTALLASGERSLRGALERLRVRWVPDEEWRSLDPDGRSFLNLNTPDDFRRAVAMQAAT